MESSRLINRSLVRASRLFLLCVVSCSLHAQTVFRYSFSDATALPDIPDASAAGNDATAGPLAVLSEDVPTTGVPDDAGNRSLDSSDPAAVRGTESGAVTTNTLLLSNDAIAAAGGFTVECWFNWEGGGAVNSIIDYAGTEKLVIDQRTEATNVVNMRISESINIPVGEAQAGSWHYAAIVFDTQGAEVVDGTITGTVTTYFDSLAPSNVMDDVTKSAFGDSLVRGIGVGQHPIGFDLDFFIGKVFEPRISLGALTPDQFLFTGGPAEQVPSLSAVGLIALALALMAASVLVLRRRPLTA